MTSKQAVRLQAFQSLTVTANTGNVASAYRVDDEGVFATVSIGSPAYFGPYTHDYTFVIVGDATATVANAALPGSGHALFADSVAAAEGDAIAIAANTRTLIEIDGLGANTETRWRGGLPSNVWEDNAHHISGIGQGFDLRVEFKVKKTAVSTDALLTFTHDIGSDPLDTNSIIIFSRSNILTKAQNVEHSQSYGWPAYGKETYIVNGGRFYVECTEAISIWKREFFIKDSGIPLRNG